MINTLKLHVKTEVVENEISYTDYFLIEMWTNLKISQELFWELRQNMQHLY